MPCQARFHPQSCPSPESSTTVLPPQSLPPSPSLRYPPRLHTWPVLPRRGSPPRPSQTSLEVPIFCPPAPITLTPAPGAWNQFSSDMPQPDPYYQDHHSRQPTPTQRPSSRAPASYYKEDTTDSAGPPGKRRRKASDDPDYQPVRTRSRVLISTIFPPAFLLIKSIK